MHAWCCVVFLTRISGNIIDHEGARFLSESLGQLTALQQLNLEGTILAFFYLRLTV